MPTSILRQNFPNALKEICFIIVLSIIAGMAVNLVRTNSIPFVQDWSTEGRLSLDNGDSLVIPPAEAETLFKENKAVFLDARGRDLFNEGHIKGAKSLPWHEVDDHYQEVVQGVDRESLVITYCDGEFCNLSHDLALFLKNAGFT
ncbi:MAG: rhodanese-like domain-containing protein, partial [Desulfobacula sp.]